MPLDNITLEKIRLDGEAYRAKLRGMTQAERHNHHLKHAFFALKVRRAPVGDARRAFELECRNRRHLYWQMMIDLELREGNVVMTDWYEWTLDYRPWLDGVERAEDWVKELS